VADQENRALAAVERDLVERAREVLVDVVVEAAGSRAGELPRSAVSAKIEVEDVEARARQGVGQAS
jgi:hypothetical protein